MQGGWRDLHDVSIGGLWDPLVRNVRIVVFPAVELRLVQCPLGPIEASAARLGGSQTLSRTIRMSLQH